MNINLKTSFLSVFLSLTILGCSDKKTKHIPENPYLKQLTEKQIGETNYYISIPKKYTIKENRGPDFSVYYFYPTDTTAAAAFSGGFYFGNHPSLFEPSDSCKTEKIQRKILKKNTEWTVYNCKGKYSIQSIVESGSSKGWNQYIHAFASANSAADLKNIFLILETMKKKEPSKQPK